MINLPKKLPGNWYFEPPPVSTRLWTEMDWVIWAAPHNVPKDSPAWQELEQILAERRGKHDDEQIQG